MISSCRWRSKPAGFIAHQLLVAGILGGVLAYPATAVDLSKSARVDSSIWRCEIKGNTAIIDEHERITILEAAGKSYAGISAYESPFQKITSVEFSVFDGAGKLIKKYTKKDMARYCGYGSEGVLYSDNCSYYFEPVVASYPFTVVSDTRKVISSLFFLPDASFYSTIPTTFQQVTLSFDRDNPVSAHPLNIELPANVYADNSNPGYDWTFVDLPAIKSVAYVPFEVARGRRISFTPAGFKLGDIKISNLTWSNFGLFYKQLAETRYLPTVDSVAPPPSHEEALATTARICEQTADDIRYVAVNIGMSGWQPEPAARTQTLGYGDCKGVTTLLISRLRAAGIHAFPCLLKTTDQGPLDTTFVDHDFNHVITMIVIDADTLFFDGTCSTCPFGVLPEGDQDVTGLAVTDAGGVLVRIPHATALENRVVRRSDISIDSTNRVTVQTTHLLFGQYAASWRSYLSGDDNDDRRTKLESYFLRGRNQMKLATYQVGGLDSLHTPLALTGAIQASQPVKPIGGIRYLLPFETLAKISFDDLDLSERTLPIDIDYPRTIIDTIVITAAWTTKCDSVRLPSTDSALFDGGSTVVTYDRQGDTLRAILRQEYRERIVPVAAIAQFGDYLKARRKLLDRPIKWHGSY